MEGLTPQLKIAEQMKRVADAHPWVPVGVPPRRHYCHADNLSLCFTLDLLPGGLSFYHLSMIRNDFGAPPSDEEARGWCAAFFGDAEPFECPSQLPGVPSRHFFWETRQIVLS